jgi:hypothetical protein
MRERADFCRTLSLQSIQVLGWARLNPFKLC